MTQNDLVAGLDIGTTKICCMVAEIDDHGELIVSGIGSCSCVGMKRGIVVDIETTMRSIEEAVGQASQQSGRSVNSAWVGVTGEHLSALSSRGVAAITRGDREITEDDRQRALQQAQLVMTPPDRDILHVVPRFYAVDGQPGIRQPVGMSGTRLEVETHIVIAGHTILQNIEKCVERAGLGLRAMVHQPLASCEVVTTEAERDQGVAMLDIGGGSSDLAIYVDGAVQGTATIPIGGMHVTNDLAALLRVTADEAERAKVGYGSAMLERIPETDAVPITQIGNPTVRRLRRRALCEIVEARVHEQFALVAQEIRRLGCEGMLNAGMVLTGGGAKLGGIVEYASKSLGIPVRLGMPGGLAGLGDAVSDPVYSTAFGLVEYGAARQRPSRGGGAGGGGVGSFLTSIKGLMDRFRGR